MTKHCLTSTIDLYTMFKQDVIFLSENSTQQLFKKKGSHSLKLAGQVLLKYCLTGQAIDTSPQRTVKPSIQAETANILVMKLLV